MFSSELHGNGNDGITTACVVITR